jgi:hypothetical protein
MILNPHSWHARWYQTLSKKPLPNDLCSYVWRFFWKNFFLLFILACISLFLFYLGLIIYHNWPFSLIVIAQAVGITIGVGVAILLIGFTFVWLEEGHFPSVVTEYLKARKEKYCPRITWEKEDL